MFLFLLQNKNTKMFPISLLWVFFLKHVRVYKKAAEENHASYWSEYAVGLNEPQSFPTLNVSSTDISNTSPVTQSHVISAAGSCWEAARAEIKQIPAVTAAEAEQSCTELQHFGCYIKRMWAAGKERGRIGRHCPLIWDVLTYNCLHKYTKSIFQTTTSTRELDQVLTVVI